MNIGHKQPAPVLSSLVPKHPPIRLRRSVKGLCKPALAAHRQHGLLDLHATQPVFLGVGVHSIHGVFNVPAAIVPRERAAKYLRPAPKAAKAYRNRPQPRRVCP